MRVCSKCKTEIGLEEFGKAHWCKLCCKEYRDKNKDKIKVAKKKHYESSKEKILKKCKEDYFRYEDRIKEYNKEYSKKNREKINRKKRATYKVSPENKLALNGKYRANKINGTPSSLTEEDNSMIREFYKEAKKLEKETGIKHHVDHIIPLSKGGLHAPQNLQVLTATDNIIKGDSLVTI